MHLSRPASGLTSTLMLAACFINRSERGSNGPLLQPKQVLLERLAQTTSRRFIYPLARTFVPLPAWSNTLQGRRPAGDKEGH